MPIPALNIQYPDLARSALAGQQFQNLQQENALRQIQVEKQKQIQNALAGVRGLEDIPGAIPGVMQADAPMGLNMLEKLSTIQQTQQARKEKVLSHGFQFLSAVDALPEEQRPQAYQYGIQQLASMYPEIVPMIKSGQVPMEYDPIKVGMIRQSLVPELERFKASQSEWGSPIAGQDAEGNPIFVSPNKKRPEMVPTAIGGGITPKDPSGLDVTLPDGTRISQGGGKGKSGSVTGLQPGTSKDIEERLVKATGMLADMHSVNSKFDPIFQTYGGQLQGKWLQVKDKWDSKAINPDEEKYLTGFTDFRAEAGRVFANNLKEMSGTAVTAPEMSRQEVHMVTTGTGVFDGDSPKDLKKKIDNNIAFQRRAVARLNYIRKNGFSIRNAQGQLDFGGISLETMDKIILDRAAVIEGKLKVQGVPKAELGKRTLQQLSEEFGLVY